MEKEGGEYIYDKEYGETQKIIINDKKCTKTQKVGTFRFICWDDVKA